MTGHNNMSAATCARVTASIAGSAHPRAPRDTTRSPIAVRAGERRRRVGSIARATLDADRSSIHPIVHRSVGFAVATAAADVNATAVFACARFEPAHVEGDERTRRALAERPHLKAFFFE